MAWVAMLAHAACGIAGVLIFSYASLAAPPKLTWPLWGRAAAARVAAAALAAAAALGAIHRLWGGGASSTAYADSPGARLAHAAVGWAAAFAAVAYAASTGAGGLEAWLRPSARGAALALTVASLIMCMHGTWLLVGTFSGELSIHGGNVGQMPGHSLIALGLTAASVLSLTEHDPAVLRRMESLAMAVGGVALMAGEFLLGSGGIKRHEHIWTGQYDSEHYITSPNQQHMAIGLGWLASGVVGLAMTARGHISDLHAVSAVLMHALVIWSHPQHMPLGTAAHLSHVGALIIGLGFRLGGLHAESLAAMFVSGVLIWFAQRSFTTWAASKGPIMGEWVQPYHELDPDAEMEHGIDPSAYVLGVCAFGLLVFTYYFYIITAAAQAAAQQRQRGVPDHNQGPALGAGDTITVDKRHLARIDRDLGRSARGMDSQAVMLAASAV